MALLSLEQIKENIVNARKKASISQAEMAKLLDISQPAYSYYEKGEKPIPLNKIQRICQILSIPTKSILGDLSIDENNQEILESINNNLDRIANKLDKLYEFLSSKQ